MISQERSPGTDATDNKVLIALIIIFAIALSIRILNFSKVFVDGNVLFLGADPYYHMHRIILTTLNFPNVIFFDPYVNYPHGFMIGWPPLYTQVVAFLALVIGFGSPSIHTIETVGAFFPAVLGAFTIFPVYFIAKEVFDQRIGILSALMLAIMPAHIHTSRLGFTDHHVAEVFLLTVLILLFMIALRKAKENRTTSLFCAISAGLVMACIVFTWMGAPIYIGLIGLYAVVQFIIDQYNRVSSNYLMFVGTIMCGMAVMVIIPIYATVQWLSSFQLLFVAFILGTFIAFGTVSKVMLDRNVQWYLYSVPIIGIFLLSLVGSFVFAPQLYHGIISGLAYLGRGSLVLVTIVETQPLIQRTFFTLADASGFVIPFVIMLIAFFIYAIINIIKIDESKPRDIFFIVWTIVVLILTLWQVRFEYLLSVNMSILMSYAFLGVLKATGVDIIPIDESEMENKRRGRGQKKAKPRRESPALQATWIIVLLMVFIAPLLYSGITTPRQNPVVAGDWHDALIWMRENTPTTSYYYNPSQMPEYGVMSWWDYGNWIIYIAQRPAVANNFQTGIPEASRFFTAENEAEANKILDQMKVKYVIVDNRMGFGYEGRIWGIFDSIATLAGKDESSFYHLFQGPTPEGMVSHAILNAKYYNTMYARLYLFNGSSAISPLNDEVGALNHFRLVYESNSVGLITTDGHIKQVKIFEYVPGANDTQPETDINKDIIPVGTSPLAWTFDSGSRIRLSSPIVHDDTIYFASVDGTIYALDLAGGLKWEYNVGSEVWVSPAISGGIVYVASLIGNIYAIDAESGALIWKTQTREGLFGGRVNNGIFSSPLVHDGILYVGSNNHNLYALDAVTGKKLWTYTGDSAIVTSPTISDGIIYVASYNRTIYAINTTGELVWERKMNNMIWSSPVVSGGMVYIGVSDDKIHALDADTGQTRWEYKTGYFVDSTPTVSDGVVYVGSYDAKVYALDADTGELIWKSVPLAPIYASPAVSENLVFVGAWDNTFYALDRGTGNIVWKHTTNGAITASAAILDGMVYVGSADGKLYAFELS